MGTSLSSSIVDRHCAKQTQQLYLPFPEKTLCFPSDKQASSKILHCFIYRTLIYLCFSLSNTRQNFLCFAQCGDSDVTHSSYMETIKRLGFFPVQPNLYALSKSQVSLKNRLFTGQLHLEKSTHPIFSNRSVSVFIIILKKLLVFGFSSSFLIRWRFHY